MAGGRVDFGLLQRATVVVDTVPDVFRLVYPDGGPKAVAHFRAFQDAVNRAYNGDPTAIAELKSTFMMDVAFTLHHTGYRTATNGRETFEALTGGGTFATLIPAHPFASSGVLDRLETFSERSESFVDVRPPEANRATSKPHGRTLTSDDARKMRQALLIRARDGIERGIFGQDHAAMARSFKAWLISKFVSDGVEHMDISDDDVIRIMQNRSNPYREEIKELLEMEEAPFSELVAKALKAEWPEKMHDIERRDRVMKKALKKLEELRPRKK